MASPRDMVGRLRPLVEAHRDRQQLPVRFRPTTWRPWLEPHAASHVLRLGTGTTDPGRGERLVGRDDLAALRREAADDDPDTLRDLFVAVMIWGSGTTNGRGPRYTADALSDPRLPHVLRTTCHAVRAGELEAAYDAFALRGVGRSFFTKWFAAVDDGAGPGDRALILDNRVLRSLNALGWTSIEAAGTRRRSARYAAYVRAVHTRAGPLEVPAPRLEWLMFHLNGQIRPV